MPSQSREKGHAEVCLVILLATPRQENGVGNYLNKVQCQSRCVDELSSSHYSSHELVYVEQTYSPTYAETA